MTYRTMLKHGWCITHLKQGVEEYLCQRLWHSEVGVTGADLKGRLQTLDGN